MLNLSFAFRDATSAVSEFGAHLEIPSLVPTVFLMQRDVINHYRHSMEHYFTISLYERYLQNSSLGSPYQKWAYFVNENHELLSSMIRNLLSYTSRLVHETECKRRFELHDSLDAKSLSNSYTSPICESRSREKPIGIYVGDDEQLTVTWIRKERRPERVTARGTAGKPTEYFLIERTPDGADSERSISIDEYRYFTESVSQSVYEIRDRQMLDEIKRQGLAEIAELEALNRNFQAVAEKYLEGQEVCLSHTNLNESYWA